MSLTKAFANAAGESGSAGAIASASFDSTGYTHVVAFIKNESGAATVTMSDNKSSVTWNSLTQQADPSNGSIGQLFWAKIGSPGSGHIVTGTFSANRDWRTLVVWLVNADTGEIELDDETTGSGTGTAVDAGSLDTTGASVVSFMGGAETSGVDWTESSGWTEDADNPGDTASFAASRGPETTTPIDPAATVTASMDWAAVAASFREAAPAATVEQKGFAFGDDDGNEATHTLDAENINTTVGLGIVKTIRTLLQAVNDPASVAYTLRAQKNGSGGYTAVGVGATTPVSPPQVTSATVTTVAAADPWTVNRPAASTGDMVVFVGAWDDSVTTTTVTPPAGVNGESAVSTAGPVASASTEMRMQAWYYVATGAWTTGTLSFDPSATESARFVAFVIPAGQFKASDVIGFASTAASAGTTESNINSPTGTAESDDGSGRLYIAFGSDADAITAPASGTTTVNNATGGGVGLCVVSRDTLVSNSESIAAITATIASDSWASLAFVIKPNIVTNEIYIAASPNVTAGGEATTNRLTGGTGSFVTGRRWDNENGSDAIDITADDFTEVEHVLSTQSPAVIGDFWDLREYAGSVPLDTYTATPRLTLGLPVLSTLSEGPLTAPGVLARQEGFVGSNLLLTTLAVVAAAIPVGIGLLGSAENSEPEFEAQSYTQGMSLPLLAQVVETPFIPGSTGYLDEIFETYGYTQSQIPPTEEPVEVVVRGHLEVSVLDRRTDEVQGWTYYLEIPPTASAEIVRGITLLEHEDRLPQTDGWTRWDINAPTSEVVQPFVSQHILEPAEKLLETQGHIAFDVNAPPLVATPFLSYETAQRVERVPELERLLYRPNVSPSVSAEPPFVRQETQDPTGPITETQGWTQWDINAPAAPATFPFISNLFDQVELDRDLEAHTLDGVSYFTEPLIPYIDWPAIELHEESEGWISRSILSDAPAVPPFIHPETSDPVERKYETQDWAQWDVTAPATVFPPFVLGWTQIDVEPTPEAQDWIQSDVTAPPSAPPFIHTEISDPVERLPETQDWFRWDVNAPSFVAPPFILGWMQTGVDRIPETQDWVQWNINAPAPVILPFVLGWSQVDVTPVHTTQDYIQTQIPPPIVPPFLPPEVGYIAEIIEREQWYGAPIPYTISSVGPVFGYLIANEIRIDPVLAATGIDLTPALSASTIRIDKELG